MQSAEIRHQSRAKTDVNLPSHAVLLQSAEYVTAIQNGSR